MRKFLSILIALSLVMSLFSGFVAAPKSVSAAEPAATEVKIVTPASAADYAPGSEYYVNAVVSNLDRVNGIVGATATLAIDGNAALVDGETATKSIDLPACGVADVWWKVQCTNPGAVKLTVTSGSGSDNVTVTQTGTVTPQNADVVVTWVETPCDATPYHGVVPVGTYFAVKALATYIPSGYAENASMTIHWTGDLELLSPATVNTGDLYAVRPEEAGWNFKCTGEGDASVWVEFNSVDVDPAKVSYPTTCEFHQGPIIPPPTPTPGSWDLTLTAPEKVCTNCAQNSFTVTAQAHNGTDSAADVYAKLVIDNPLLAAFQPSTVNPKPGESVAAHGNSSVWSWDVTCLLQGATSFTVNLYHALADATPFYHESITVNQMNYMVRLGDVNNLSPATMVYAADESEYVNFNPNDLSATTEVCDTFTVKTTFENCTCAPMGNGVDEFVFAKVNLPATVKLTGDITVEEWARVPSGSDPTAPGYEPYGATALKDSYTVPASAVVDGWLPLPTNCACCYFVITWKLECIGSDAGVSNTVSFEAYRDVRGTKTLLDGTGFDLLQESAPHIQTGIDYLPGLYTDGTLGTSSIGVIAAPCAPDGIGASNAFTVVIPVSNTGDVTADNVVLTAALTGDFTNATYAILKNGTLSTPAAFTSAQAIALGNIAGHTAEKILISASCSGPDDVVAHIVSVTGYDDLKGETCLIDSTNDGVDNDAVDSCNNHYVCFAADKTLVQIPLSFTIVEPTPQQQIMVSSNYAVKVIVKNCSTVDTEVLHGLQASLGFEGQVEFNNDTAIHLLGDLAPGNSAETSWNVHCTGASGLIPVTPTASAIQQTQDLAPQGSPTTFTVTLTGSDPVLAMTRSIGVLQMPTSDINITISSPRLIPGSSNQWLEYATGQKFALTAYVSNAGPLPAENVTIDVFSSVDGMGVPAFQVVDDPQTAAQLVNIGTLAVSEGKFVTWTMQAVRPTRPYEDDFPVAVGGFNGGSGIALAGAADNSNMTLDTMHAYSYPAANLVVTLDPIPDVTAGTDFTVTGTVTNIGGADATDVKLNLTSLLGNVAPAVGSSFTKYIGTLPGAHEGLQNATAVPFSFQLQSEGSGKTSIRVTPEGKDEYGFSAVYAAWQQNGLGMPEELWGVGPFWRMWFDVSVPLSPIPDFCITTADATFNQLDNVNPVITPTAGQDGAIVNDPHFTLTGKATDNDGIASFYINGMLVNVLPDGTFAYPVVLAEGANTFVYKAFDAADNMATTTITVTYVIPVDPLLKTATLSYIEGWNLVTVPLNSTTLSGLAGDVNFTGEIYGYSQTAGWFIPTGFEAGQGYWLNMKAAGTATIYGYEVASPQLTNYASGWVLIGSPYSVGGDTVRVIVGVNPPMLLKDAVASAFVGNIFYFDGSWKAFDATTDAIQPGLGYWVEVKAAASIVFVKP